MWTRQSVTSIVTIGRTACLAIVMAGVLGTASSRAQTRNQPGERVDGGFFQTFGGHTIVVHVTEVGPADVTSFVRVSVLASNEKALFVQEGQIERGQPVRVEVPLNRTLGRVSLRVSVAIAGAPDRGSKAIVGVDDLDPVAGTIVLRGLCSPPGGHGDPLKDVHPAPCPGWQITDFTTLEPLP